MDYLGIDVGTTNIKTAVYDELGNLKSFASCPTPRQETINYVKYEYDPNEIFEHIVYCLQRIHEKCGSVKALAVSSMGESGVLLDRELRPLTNAIPWFDPRTIPQSNKLINAIGAERLFFITGQFPSSKFGITKLMWYKDNMPMIFEKAHHWMSINDYILYRLCGEIICDYSIAARTMAFDIRRLYWSKSICTAAGINQGFFSKPVPGGSCIGTITQEVADRTGLSNKILVVTGGHDHLCAMVGSGSLSENSVLNSMGTSEVSVFVLQDPITSNDMFINQCCISPHCSKRLYRVFSSMQACGASIEWFLNSIGKSLQCEAKTLGIDKFCHFENIAKNCQSDESLLYFPLIRGSLLNPDAGGLFVGIRDNHRLENFAHAIIDGLCCEFAWQTENCSKILKTEIKSVQVVGGPASSNFMMQRKADISGLTVEISPQQEAACYGASLLAAIGVGDIDFEELGEKAKIASEKIIPNKNSKKFQRYCKIRKLVDEMNQMLV